jgi:hypothetical protein
MKQTKCQVSRRALQAVSVAGFVILGLLFALGDIVNYAQLGQRFTPFSVAYPVSAQTYDETGVYVPGARWFFDENKVQTEVDIFELRDTGGAYPGLAHSIVIGSIAKIFGSLEVSWVIVHGLFPASIWLLLFFFARMLQLPVVAALLLATATCLIPFGPRNFFLLGHDALIQPLELSRMPQPGLSFALLLLAIMGVSRAAASSTTLAEVSAGILVGANFYTYYFYWMALGLGLSAWLGAAAMLRRWRELKALCVVGLAAAATGLPFVVIVALGLQSQSQKDLMERVGYFGRNLSPTDLGITLILTGAVIWCYARGRMQPLSTALAFALAGGALGLSVHLLTGYNAQHEHFLNRCIQPLLFFLLGMAFLRWLPRRPLWPWLYASATLLLLSLGTYRQVQVADTIAESHDRTQNSVQLVERLRDRIPAGSVVGTTDPQLLTLLPAISTLYTFVPLGDRSHASNDEILRRFLLLRKLQGATISDVHADFERTYPTNREDRKLSSVLFMNTLNGSNLNARIDQMWPELNLANDLSVRRLDVLVATGTPPSLPQSSGWQLVSSERIGEWNFFYLQPAKP